jgi:hypothetical protein
MIGRYTMFTTVGTGRYTMFTIVGTEHNVYYSGPTGVV